MENNRAFTLVEVLIAMVIFAIGFAMIAGVVPAGHLLNRQAEDDILAAVAGRNAAAFIEAKKIHAPILEHDHLRGTVAEGGHNGGELASVAGADARAAARGGIARALDGSFGTAADTLPSDGDTLFDAEDFFCNAAAAPAQACPGWPAAAAGFRFFADTNNDGVSGDGLSPYPATDTTNLPMGRIHAYHHRVGFGDLLPASDLGYPGFAEKTADKIFLCTPIGVDLNADASSRRFVVLMAVLRRRAGDTWPERGTDPTQGGCPTGCAGDSFPRLVTPSNPSGLLSIEGNSHPNGGAAANAGYWNTFCAGGDDADPSIPGLYSVPMIVHDYSNSLIEVQYPPCWTPGAYAPFVSAGVDRRLKTGDLFIARESGTVFTVLSARDLESDPRYQILEVHPPLRSTLLGPNANPAWRLRAGLFAPPPASGGPSPLVRVETIPATRGFTSNPNH